MARIGRLVALVLIYAICQVTDAQCPAGFASDVGTGMCLFLSEFPASSNSAQTLCNNLGSSLPSIHTDAEQNAILQYTLNSDEPTALWHIGLRRVSGSVFQWLDNSTVDYTKWLPGQPASTAGYNCVSLNVQQNGWSVNPCTDSHPYICQYNPGNIQPTPPPINIPTPPTRNDTAYRQAVAYFLASINVAADPCNDFYSYACGNYRQPISFSVVDYKNFQNQAAQMLSGKYDGPDDLDVSNNHDLHWHIVLFLTVRRIAAHEGLIRYLVEDGTYLEYFFKKRKYLTEFGKMKEEKTPTSLQKTLRFFQSCRDYQTNYETAIANGSLPLQAISDLSSFTGLTFSMIEAQGSNVELPSATALARALGLLSDSYDTDTLLTAFVDTNWLQPNGSEPYKFFVDQPTLFYPLTYYASGTWTLTQTNYRAYARDLFRRYARLRGKTLNETQLAIDVDSLLSFELYFANNFMTDDTTRRQYRRNWNLYTQTTAAQNFPFIDWPAYLATVSASASGTVTLANLNFVVMEPMKTGAMSTTIITGDGITGTQLINYLFFRLLASQDEYLPDLPSNVATKENVVYRAKKPLLGRPKHIRMPEPRRRRAEKADVDDISVACAATTLDYMQYANGRFFVDFLYPTPIDQSNIRIAAGNIIENILTSFQCMLAGLPWMTDTSRAGAYEKVTDLVKNIAFPDFIVDNATLDEYYSLLTFDANDGYFQMIKKLQRFNRYLQYNYLTKSSGERDDFLGPPGIVNAWYQPELNSITLPAGILQQPYFDINWPASINYGGLGLVAGHELTHGFDDEGVQWNGIGQLDTWMDTASQTGFQRMADCVIQEYGNFCPLDNRTYTPSCVNGVQTQGENIADNGGIHAAFRAYRNHVALFGPDENLPDSLIGQYTHDQLFFLSFAQTWCRAPLSPEAIYRQLLIDPHSPAEYRVWGTIENFPGFRNAFNCPRGSQYAPNDHCNVWVLDNA